jgi:hypothetical protein
MEVIITDFGIAACGNIKVGINTSNGTGKDIYRSY